MFVHPRLCRHPCFAVVSEGEQCALHAATVTIPLLHHDGYTHMHMHAIRTHTHILSHYHAHCTLTIYTNTHPTSPLQHTLKLPPLFPCNTTHVHPHLLPMQPPVKHTTRAGALPCLKFGYEVTGARDCTAFLKEVRVLKGRAACLLCFAVHCCRGELFEIRVRGHRGAGLYCVLEGGS
jgi:hypothetical protein